MSLDYALVFLAEVFLEPLIWAGVGVIVLIAGMVILRIAARMMKS